MDRQKVTCLLTYFASGAQAYHKPAIPLDSAPTKQVLPQGRFKIVNKPQETMSGKTNRLVNQEGREIYGNEATEDATEILQGDDEFVGADDEFEAARAYESAASSRLQRSGNLAGHATGKVINHKEEKTEENA